MAISEIAPWAALVVALFFFLWVDLHYFGRDAEPNFRQALVWSIGWLVLSLLVAVPVLVLEDSTAAVEYTTVYLIERSLSLDNLFVFLLLFAYFGVPYKHRPRLLFWGIVAALVLRLVFIAAGVALIEQFHVVIYVLGALLIVLAYRVWQGVEENVNPERNVLVRVVRRFYPVTDGFRNGHWFVNEGGRRYTTPLFLCLSAIVFADLAFAIDSIPAAFAITRDPLIIWMGNVFALLGLRALFVLVEGLIRRFRYLDETIALLLGLVGVKLLTEDLVHIGPLASFGIVAFVFAGGIVVSALADRRDPEGAQVRREKLEAAQQAEHELAEPVTDGAPEPEPAEPETPAGRPTPHRPG